MSGKCKHCTWCNGAPLCQGMPVFNDPQSWGYETECPSFEEEEGVTSDKKDTTKAQD